MSKGFFALYVLFLTSILAPSIGFPLALLIVLIIILGLCALIANSGNKNSDNDEKNNANNVSVPKKSNNISSIQNEEKVLEKSKPETIKQNAPPERKTQEQFHKKPEKTVVGTTPVQSNKHEPQKDVSSEEKEESCDNIVQRALSLYDSFSEVEKRVIDIDHIIAKTQKDELMWYEGGDCRVIAWASYYQNELLVLYKDLVEKKYKFVFFEEKVGFIQKLTRITELRRAIEAQIDNRKVNKETVSSTGFLVRTNMFKCIRNHEVEDIIAVFRVLNAQGRIVQVEAPAAKCEQCKVYYIHEYIFQKVLTYGTPLCQVITEKQYLNGSYLKMNPGMAQKSLLKICGYSVSATEGLSDQERQRILESIIENGIMTRHEVIQYLNYFISMRKNQSRDMSEAISKWKKDVNFVENMRLSGVSRYIVNTIYRIEK